MSVKQRYNSKKVREYLDFFQQPDGSRLHISGGKNGITASNSDGQIYEVGTWYHLKNIPHTFDQVVLENMLGRSDDIQLLLEQLRPLIHRRTLIIVTEYNMVWNAAIRLHRWLSGKEEATVSNWLSHSDVKNLFSLEGMEVFRHTRKILLPFNIPFLSIFFNKVVANMPLLNHLCLNHFYFARFLSDEPAGEPAQYSVSIIIPARNEAGNIENILNRIPLFGSRQEIIFIEGNSSDNTWGQMLYVQQKYQQHNIIVLRQTGKGKGNAVREAFRQASGDILMILDADISVEPEDLPKFYDALAKRRGDFINGCRLVYKMEENAMRGFNLIGNKVFSRLFSWLLHQPIKDTLCGTKVLLRSHYLALEKNRSYFGNFDPFGDFDLLFGAYKLGLKIIDLPVSYKARRYGTTNISRWKHGWILLKMWAFAVVKIKFNP
ncbi:glycosyltransferase family 2 protein [Chitinophaga sp.]|uniref:glycosyltransferase family 2 protein n=1 Tax=Chitinophaga sp. TaxID=1869181 RepID=UPI002F9314ED